MNGALLCDYKHITSHVREAKGILVFFKSTSTTSNVANVLAPVVAGRDTINVR